MKKGLLCISLVLVLYYAGIHIWIDTDTPVDPSYLSGKSNNEIDSEASEDVGFVEELYVIDGTLGISDSGSAQVPLDADDDTKSLTATSDQALASILTPDELYELNSSLDIEDADTPPTIPLLEVMPDELIELELGYNSDDAYIDPLDSLIDTTNEFSDDEVLPPSVGYDPVIPYELKQLEDESYALEGEALDNQYQEPLWDDPVSEIMYEEEFPG